MMLMNSIEFDIYQKIYVSFLFILLVFTPYILEKKKDFFKERIFIKRMIQFLFWYWSLIFIVFVILGLDQNY